ncbi:MAG: LacI family DNA-binding transcriptional regulator [Flavisolibacter sp.]|nr:LacI family DNA-binding transcriptional regulator [Flavisolibacter sp.]
MYINLMEDDLVSLIEKLIATDFVIGKDIGIISYNETLIKKVLLNGITTMSTDFQMMGEKTAELILNQSIEQLEVKFHLNLRNSL